MTRMQDAAFDLLDAITKLFGVWWVRDHPFRSLICVFAYHHMLFVLNIPYFLFYLGYT
jgi:hypothetical protein